jgi:regulator of nonsense transcripts 2
MILGCLNVFFCRLAESLDMQPPVMPDDGNTTRVTTGTDALPSSGKESSALEPIWDDEDTKAFYESLPDLRFTFHYKLPISVTFFSFLLLSF